MAFADLEKQFGEAVFEQECCQVMGSVAGVDVEMAAAVGVSLGVGMSLSRLKSQMRRVASSTRAKSSAGQSSGTHQSKAGGPLPPLGLGARLFFT